MLTFDEYGQSFSELFHIHVNEYNRANFFWVKFLQPATNGVWNKVPFNWA